MAFNVAMQKSARRVVSAVIVFLLVFATVASMVVPAFAAGTTYEVLTGVYEPDTWNMECGRFYNLSELGLTSDWSDHPTAYKGADAATTSFKDVKSNNWFYAPVMAMTEVGLFAGTTTPVNGVGTFEPNNTMTRAQFATVVARAFWPEEFAEMPATSPWYAGAVNLLMLKGALKNPERPTDYLFYASNGSTSGGGGLTIGVIGGVPISTENYSAEKPITRAEAATILVNVFNVLNLEGFSDSLGHLLDEPTDGLNSLFASAYTPDEDSFDVCYLFQGFGTSKYGTDTPSIYTYMQIAYLLGLVNGMSGGKVDDTHFTQIDLNPDGELTRAQGAAMLYRVLEVDGRTDNTVFVIDPSGFKAD